VSGLGARRSLGAGASSGVASNGPPRKVMVVGRVAGHRRSSVACVSMFGVSSGPTVFGRVSRAGVSGHAAPSSVDRGGAMVATAAAEADHYTAAA
jgi:hypothetical protein